jgi:hypothetical protein
LRLSAICIQKRGSFHYPNPILVHPSLFNSPEIALQALAFLCALFFLIFFLKITWTPPREAMHPRHGPHPKSEGTSVAMVKTMMPPILSESMHHPFHLLFITLDFDSETILRLDHSEFIDDFLHFFLLDNLNLRRLTTGPKFL